jgi:TolA-binding protein
MKRLEILLEKRDELVNQLIELRVWHISNPTAKVDESIQQLDNQLDELQEKIERLRMDS